MHTYTHACILTCPQAWESEREENEMVGDDDANVIDCSDLFNDLADSVEKAESSLPTSPTAHPICMLLAFIS